MFVSYALLTLQNQSVAWLKTQRQIQAEDQKNKTAKSLGKSYTATADWATADWALRISPPPFYIPL